MRTKQADPASRDLAIAQYQWWTTAEMAERAGGVSSEQVRRWIRDRLLPALNVSPGKRKVEYRIRPEDGQRFIDQVLSA